MDEFDKQPFTAHLEELRDRMIVAFVAILMGICVYYCVTHLMQRNLPRSDSLDLFDFY